MYKENYYKTYIFTDEKWGYLLNDWQEMKRISRRERGIVDWKWIEKFEIGSLQGNQNPYELDEKGVFRELYGKKIYCCDMEDIREFFKKNK